MKTQDTECVISPSRGFPHAPRRRRAYGFLNCLYNRLGSCRDLEVGMTFFPALAAFAFSIVVAVSFNPVEAKTCEEPDNITFVQGERHCLAIETFSSTSRPDALVVTLHGALS